MTSFIRVTHVQFHLDNCFKSPVSVNLLMFLLQLPLILKIYFVILYIHNIRADQNKTHMQAEITQPPAHQTLTQIEDDVTPSATFISFPCRHTQRTHVKHGLKRGAVK